METFDQELWEKCVDFHGHACPGLAIGYKASEAAVSKLNLNFSKDEELVCVTETDACGVDAIQYITGCTAGKGNLVFRPVAKHAFSFFERESSQKVRLVMKSQLNGPEDRGKRLQWLLHQDWQLLFEVKSPDYSLPKKAKIFDTVICDKCGEGAAEFAMRLEKGKKVCLDCYSGYSSGLGGMSYKN